MKVDLRLTSTAPQSVRPSYTVHARSSQKPVDITCMSAPSDALAHFEVQTTNAPASVTVPESFEGTFALHSTPFKPVVSVYEQKEGEKEVQVRTLVYKRERRGLAEGRVVSPREGDIVGDAESQMSASTSSTVERKEKESSVVIKTSNAEARLFL